jgi:peptidoglycan/LPS O-acetylase OafA/YrhL
MAQQNAFRDPAPAESETKTPPTNRGISNELSRKLTAVSFFSACCIVLLHANPRTPAASKAADTFIYFLSVVMTSFAVPLFFAISGYLIAKKTDSGRFPGWYPAILKKRGWTLLVPYLAWCTVFAVLFVPLKMLGNRLTGKMLLDNTFLSSPLFSFENIGCVYGLFLSEYPALRTLWYVRNLLLLCLLTPLLFPLLRRRRMGLFFLTLVGCLYLLFPALYPFFYGPGFNLQGLLFFPLGIYLANYPVKQNSFCVFRKVLPFIWVFFAVLSTWFFKYSGMTHDFSMRILSACVITGVGSVWCLYDMIPAFRRLGGLRVSKDSFFLYASHLLIMDTVTGSQMQHFLKQKLHVPELGVYFLRFLIPLVLSLLAAEILKRFLPWLYRILTGGR